MSITRFLLGVFAAWLVIGLTLAFIMRRRGHSFNTWLVLGVVLGPLAVPLAVERARFHSGGSGDTTAVEPNPGRFNVLAGLDGSSEAMNALHRALDLFGDTISGLTIATVLDHEATGSHTGRQAQDNARKVLESATEEIAYDRIETVVLFGRPDLALIDYATQAGIAMIVVGARGRGASETLFGSVTGRLVGNYQVPVFVGTRTTVSPASVGSGAEGPHTAS